MLRPSPYYSDAPTFSTKTSAAPAPFTYTGGIELENAARSFALFPDLITPEEERSLLRELKPVLKRKRYEDGHFDKVIFGFRELERVSWEDPDNAATVARVRGVILGTRGEEGEVGGSVGLGEAQAEERQQQQQQQQQQEEAKPLLPATHVIDLKKGGRIDAHVDSVKFSGGLVAGLSLSCDAEMVLRPYDAERDAPVEGKEARCVLPRRSLYIMSGEARYAFTHEVSGELDGERRGRRISLMFRDEL